MWYLEEPKNSRRLWRSLPPQVRKKYELWKSIVSIHGPEKLREFPGFNDEALKGERAGQRSSRLNIQFRVIYEIEYDVVTVYVIEITPHDY